MEGWVGMVGWYIADTSASSSVTRWTWSGKKLLEHRSRCSRQLVMRSHCLSSQLCWCRSSHLEAARQELYRWCSSSITHEADYRWVETISDRTTQSFNAVIGHFPTTFKEAFITPVIKKPGLDSADIGSYRPISNLSVISKLLERIVAKQAATSNLLISYHSYNLASDQVIPQRRQFCGCYQTSWQQSTVEALRHSSSWTCRPHSTQSTTFCVDACRRRLVWPGLYCAGLRHTSTVDLSMSTVAWWSLSSPCLCVGTRKAQCWGWSYSCFIQLTSSLLSSAMVFALPCMPMIRKCTAHADHRLSPTSSCGCLLAAMTLHHGWGRTGYNRTPVKRICSGVLPHVGNTSYRLLRWGSVTTPSSHWPAYATSAFTWMPLEHAGTCPADCSWIYFAALRKFRSVRQSIPTPVYQTLVVALVLSRHTNAV